MSPEVFKEIGLFEILQQELDQDEQSWSRQWLSKKKKKKGVLGFIILQLKPRHYNLECCSWANLIAGISYFLTAWFDSL